THAAFLLAELGTARAAEERPAALHDAADVARSELDELAGAQPGEPVANADRAPAVRRGRAHDGADRGVHARGVAARGENRDLHGVPLASVVMVGSLGHRLRRGNRGGGPTQ